MLAAWSERLRCGSASMHTVVIPSQMLPVRKSSGMSTRNRVQALLFTLDPAFCRTKLDVAPSEFEIPSRVAGHSGTQGIFQTAVVTRSCDSQAARCAL